MSNFEFRISIRISLAPLCPNWKVHVGEFRAVARILMLLQTLSAAAIVLRSPASRAMSAPAMAAAVPPTTLHDPKQRDAFHNGNMAQYLVDLHEMLRQPLTSAEA